MCRYVRSRIVHHNLYLLVISSIFFIITCLTIETFAQEDMKAYPAAEKSSLEQSPGKDVGYAVAVDDNGNVYVAGTSDTQWGKPVNFHTGDAEDCFVAKLNQRGVMLWHTFLGGSRHDSCRAIALDGKGYVYVTGESGSQWAEAPLRGYRGGSYDCFVAKLDPNGVLLWHTFLGGALYDGGFSLAVDKDVDIFVAGNSVNTWGTPVNPHTGRNHDSFVAKLDKNGLLQWNTFLGGSDYDGGYALALDENNNVILAGESSSEWGIPVNEFIQGYYGDYNAYVAKLDNKGVLQWHTFIGGSGSDYGRGVAVDMKGYIYVTGNSNASWGKPLTPHSGGEDAFAVKFNDQGALQWNTFLGGKGSDLSRSITANWTGNIFLTGQSSMSWGKPFKAFGGESDAFAVKLDSNGIVQWNTFLSGGDNDFGRHITMDGVGNIFLTGESSSDFETSGSQVMEKSRTFAAKLSNGGKLRWFAFLGEIPLAQ